LSKVDEAPTKTKTKTEKKKKNRVLTFKLVLQNSLLLKLQAFHYSSSKFPKPKCSKLSTLQALSSLNPNAPSSPLFKL